MKLDQQMFEQQMSGQQMSEQQCSSSRNFDLECNGKSSASLLWQDHSDLLLFDARSKTLPESFRLSEKRILSIMHAGIHLQLLCREIVKNNMVHGFGVGTFCAKVYSKATTYIVPRFVISLMAFYTTAKLSYVHD